MSPIGQQAVLFIPHCSECKREFNVPGIRDYLENNVLPREDVPLDADALTIEGAHVGFPGDRNFGSVSLCLCRDCIEKLGLKTFANLIRDYCDKKREEEQELMSRAGVGLPGTAVGRASRLVSQTGKRMVMEESTAPAMESGDSGY